MKKISDSALARLRGASVPNLLGNRYRLLEEVARGGMGVIYSANDEYLQRRVAIKLPDEAGPSAELANRLAREAQVLARLEHPGIVPIHDAGTTADGRVFYVMKYIDGQRLDEHVTTLSSASDRLRTFLRVCEAVAFAHSRGVIHRDLKPSNVMVGSFGEVLVMDWGLAKVLGEAGEPHRQTTGHPTAPGTTSAGAVMGTPGYMSPEQASGEIESLNERSDVYALGALLQFMLAPTTLSRQLAAICEKACADESHRRYASAQELASDISRHLDGLAVAAYPEGILRKTERLYQRYRPVVWMIAAYLLMRILWLIFFHR